MVLTGRSWVPIWVKTCDWLTGFEARARTCCGWQSTGRVTGGCETRSRHHGDLCMCGNQEQCRQHGAVKAVHGALLQCKRTEQLLLAIATSRTAKPAQQWLVTYQVKADKQHGRVRTKRQQTSFLSCTSCLSCKHRPGTQAECRQRRR